MKTLPNTTRIRGRNGLWTAACRDCKWLGPDRKTEPEARRDQQGHIDEHGANRTGVLEAE